MIDQRKEQSTRFASVIGVNLVLAREAAGLTQHELANLALTSRATIAQIEAGVGDPRLSTITALANALGVSPHLMITGRVEANRMLDILDNPHEIIDLAPDDADTHEIEAMVRSRVPKENRLAARHAAQYVIHHGYRSIGSRVGAAVLNAHIPGIGAAMGGYLYQPHDEDEEELKNAGE